MSTNETTCNPACLDCFLAVKKRSKGDLNDYQAEAAALLWCSGLELDEAITAERLLRG